MRPFAEGWDVQAVVPGEQTAWLRTTTDTWLAKVRYGIRRGDGSERVLHTSSAPAEAVQLRQDSPTRQDPSSRKRH